MSNIKTGTGCTLAIGTTLAAPNGTQAEYEADSYTTVGQVETIGEFGDQRAIVSFIDLASGRTQKARGAADAGDSVITYAHQTAEGGQDAIKAAYEATSQATDEFNFRVMLNDQISVNPTKFYFRARVTQRRVQEIKNDGVIMVQAQLAITTAILEVAAA